MLTEDFPQQRRNNNNNNHVDKTILPMDTTHLLSFPALTILDQSCNSSYGSMAFVTTCFNTVNVYPPSIAKWQCSAPSIRNQQ